MGHVILDVGALVAGVVIIVWGAETFAEHLAAAAARLGVTSFALARPWPRSGLQAGWHGRELGRHAWRSP